MVSLINFICIFIIVFSISQITKSQDEHLWKTYKLIHKDGWISKFEMFDNPVYVYSLCKAKPLNQPRRECIIILHKDIHDNTTKPKECTFTLENASRGIIRIMNFGSDKAIFAWNNEATKNDTLHWIFRMAVIQMSNCSIQKLGLVARTKTTPHSDQVWHIFHMNVLVYKDTFDVIVQRVDACRDAEDKRHCMYTYNSEGKRIEGPITRFKPRVNDQLYQVRQISRNSSDKGYLYTVGHKTLRISIAKPKGNSSNEMSTTLLCKVTAEQNHHVYMTSYSCNNHKIMICNCQSLSLFMSCNCLQTDEEGGSRNWTKVEIRKSYPEIPVVTFVHNLRNGGFLFLLMITNNERHFYKLTRVSADGRMIGEPIILGSHDRVCDAEFVNLRFEEQNDGQYCITIACNEKTYKDRFFKTFTKCFDLSSLDRLLYAKDRFEL